MLIRGGQVFIDGGFQPVEVRIHNGKIHEIGAELSAGLYEEIMDLEGDYLLPGFVDTHIHAFAGRDVMQGEEAVRSMSRKLFREGVSAFCPTTMSASPEETKAALTGIRSVMQRQEIVGSRVLGAHMEAPFLNESKAGAQLTRYMLDPDMAYLQAVTDGDLSVIRVITMAPEREGAEEVIRALTRQGIRVSVGHTAAEAEQVHQAADWGASRTTHTFNAQTPIHHRKPGVPGAALTDERYFCEMICDNVHLHRDIVRLIARCKGPEKAVAITDAMEAAGMPDGEYTLGGQKVFVHGAEARLADGTLAGSVLTMRRAMENLIHLFGIAPADAAAMCTSAPADSVGETLAGRIIPGSPAPLTRWTREWRFAGILA